MKLKPSKIHVALDSNIFRHRDFIAFLIINKSKFNIHLPTIVQIETGYYYILRGLTWKDFQDDISKFNAIPIKWKLENTPKLLKFAKKNKIDLPFKHHFRDFMIGTECATLKLDLITNNLRHFQWVPNINIFTPEQFIQRFLNEKNKNKRKF